MKIISNSIFAILVLAFCFISLPENLNAQTFGCCRSVGGDPIVPEGECVSCEGQSCVTRNDICLEEGGFFSSGICTTQNDGAVCAPNPFGASGCCVVQQGQCLDEVSNVACITDEDGVVWVDDELCSNVSLCQDLPRNVPTLSEWSLIILAGALGIIGFLMAVRRSKATA